MGKPHATTYNLADALYRVDDVQFLSQLGVQTSEYFPRWGRPRLKPRDLFILHVPERTAVNMSWPELVKALVSGRLVFSSRKVLRGR